MRIEASSTISVAERSSIALVHDYLLVRRGAERTFAAMAACFPEAPIYTLLYDAEAMAQDFDGRQVHTSYLQRLGLRQRGFRALLPLLPTAVEALPVGGYDVVVSSSSAFAHGIRPGPGAAHICYCHSPFRYAWHERDRSLGEAPPSMRPFVRTALDRVRRWDVEASRRVTAYVANSRITQERIRRFYGRESTVVHPPVDVGRFRPGTPEDFFLVVAEVLHHKGVELALEAARLSRRPLKVVGDGPKLSALRDRYGASAEFLGRVDDSDLESLYPRALAVIVPNVEEFGIVAVEAQAAGRPVVAANSGGALETVIPGVTGLHVRTGDVDALARALSFTDFGNFDSSRIRANAERFSAETFRRRFSAEVHRARAMSLS